MEEEIVEEGGITIGQIFRTIFSQKWLALIIVAAITIIGTLGLYFTGKRSEVYSVSFVLQLPDADAESPASYTYPDGSSFYYTDLISAQNLKEVASREGFDGVNVDKMVKNGGVSISINDPAKSGVSGLGYTVRIKSSYFKSKGAARDFIVELISLPGEHIGSMNIDYDQSLTASKSLITYDGKLDSLKKQADYILSNYEDIIASYGKDCVVKGKSLGFYQTQLQTFLTKNLTLDNLKTWALSKQYVMGDENGQPLAAAIEQYSADILTKKDELRRLQGALDTLYVGTDGQTSVIVDSTVLEYALQAEQLKTEIAYYEKFTSENCTYNKDFDNAVNAAEAQVEAFTSEFAEISSLVYKNKSTVNYLNSAIIEVGGGRGLIISAVISFVLAVIVAAVVAYIVGWSKQKKAGAKQSAGVTPGGEAQAQAAVSDAEDKKDKK